MAGGKARQLNGCDQATFWSHSEASRSLASDDTLVGSMSEPHTGRLAVARMMDIKRRILGVGRALDAHCLCCRGFGQLERYARRRRPRSAREGCQGFRPRARGCAAVTSCLTVVFISGLGDELQSVLHLSRQWSLDALRWTRGRAHRADGHVSPPRSCRQSTGGRCDAPDFSQAKWSLRKRPRK